MDSSFNINKINSTSNTVIGTNQASFDENQFLTLLTEQLRNQTPFEPVDSDSFNNQMASFSNMEEQRQLNTNLLKLLDYQGVLARAQGLSQGSALLGKDVEYVGDDGDTLNGTVGSVFVADSGDVQLRLTDGSEIDLRKVLGITEPGASA